MKLKTSVDCLLSVADQSDKTSTALYALSTLLGDYADNGGELDGTQTEGLSVLLDLLQETLASSVCNNWDCINHLKEFSQASA